MSTFVILIRNPGTGKVFIVTEDGEHDCAASFPTREAAQKCADTTPVCRAWPYQIVEFF